jgi:hypothetical protein
MSHHYSAPDGRGFPDGDARLDLADLYAFPKPGDVYKSILIMDVHPSVVAEGNGGQSRATPRSARRIPLEDSGACEMERHLLLSWLCSTNVVGARPSHLISAPADQAAGGHARR